MARIPFSLRIDAEDRTALEHLSELEGRSINQLVNEAIKIFSIRSAQSKPASKRADWHSRKNGKHDPGFERAIAAFVDAEVRHEDQPEGKPVEGQFVEGQFKPAPQSQVKIRRFLRA